MKIAIIDDAGIGSGRSGLYGKELYVQVLSDINERILRNEVVKIMLGHFENSPEVITIRGSGIPVVRAFRDSVLENRLQSVLSIERPDVLHVNVLNARYPRSIVRVAKKLGIPIVVTLHSWVYLCPTGWSVYLPELSIDREPCVQFRCARCLGQIAKMYDLDILGRVADGYNQTLALRRLLENARAIISPSKLLAESVRTTLRKNNVHVLLNPTPSKLLGLEPHYGGDGSLVFFARLAFEKGAHLLPSIAESFPDITIHVMGSGPLKNLIEKASKRYKNIMYHGYVPEDTKIEIVTRSTAVLMPVLYTETFGYTVLESLVLGKAIVCFAIGGPKEMVEASRGGLLAKPFDVKDFVQKVQYLIENPAEGKAMGMKGRKWVEDNLHPNQYADALGRIYKRALNNLANNHM